MIVSIQRMERFVPDMENVFAANAYVTTMSMNNIPDAIVNNVQLVRIFAMCTKIVFNVAFLELVQ